MKMQLILLSLVYFVNFGSTSIPLHNQMINHVHRGSEIRENFQNLFDSIAKHDSKRSGIYHNILEEEEARKQETFDTMREELQNAQNRKVNKKMNFPKKNNMGNNIVAKKREAENNQNTASSLSFNQTELEDMFVDHFKDNYTNFKDWQPIKDWYLEDGEPKLKKFCTSAHRMSGRGTIDINVIVLRPRFITFEQYQPKRVDVVAYGFADPNARNPDMLYWHTPEGTHWYITEGLQPDCVFYATIPNITIPTLKLTEYICGIDVPK